MERKGEGARRRLGYEEKRRKGEEVNWLICEEGRTIEQ